MISFLSIWSFTGIPRTKLCLIAELFLSLICEHCVYGRLLSRPRLMADGQQSMVVIPDVSFERGAIRASNV